MNLREFIRFTYGLFMGTSTPFIKPKDRYMYPTKLVEIDAGLSLLLGGSGVCGILVEHGETLVINVNSGSATSVLRADVDTKAGRGAETVILTSVDSDFSGGLEQFADAKRIYAGAQVGRSGAVVGSPAGSEKLRAAFGDLSGRVEVVSAPQIIEVAGERVHLIPVAPAATDTDLVVFLEKRSILFAGPLFYNRIHPILRLADGMHIASWISTFEGLLTRLQPKFVVPAEGDIGSLSSALEFISYLRALTDPAVEFSACRQRYDWTEIPSQTSLEENFDLLREKVKTFTTLN